MFSMVVSLLFNVDEVFLYNFSFNTDIFVRSGLCFLEDMMFMEYSLSWVISGPGLLLARDSRFLLVPMIVDCTHPVHSYETNIEIL